MALGNEASTEPRIAKLEVSEQPGCDESWRTLRAGATTAAVADPAQWTPLRRRHYRTGGNAKNGSMNLCAVALVKQDRENDLFHIFDLEDRSERSA